MNQDQGPVAEVLLESLRKHLDVIEVDRARGVAVARPGAPQPALDAP